MTEVSRPAATIYGEEPEDLSRPTPSKAILPFSFDEKDMFSSLEDEKERREWQTPICLREKLAETLNTLEGGGYTIFTVLPLGGTHIQIICFHGVSS